jgi:hypothetical protein
MARPSTTSPKKDMISASVFKDASAEALMRLCADTAATNPRFSYAIAKIGGIKTAFVADRRRSSMSDHEGTAFSNALRAGQLGYARLLAARLDSWAQTHQSSAAKVIGAYEYSLNFPKITKILLSSPIDDAKALRARSWLWTRFGPEALKPARALADEARIAFASGRPAVGLALCQELLEREPDHIAGSTPYQLADLPSSAAKLVIPVARFGVVDAAKFRSGIASQSSQRGYGEQTDQIANAAAFDHASLLSLGAFWRSALDMASKINFDSSLAELGRKIGATMDALWIKGACSSPRDTAERFAALPYGPSSPQARAMALVAPHDLARALGPLWLSAAEQAEAPCGTQPRWDAFVQAHLGLHGISPNPFALLPAGQSPALWSLCGDASLIAMGLSRGFDPKPIQHLLVKPGACGQTFSSQGATLRPNVFHHPLAQNHPYQILACPVLFIDKERTARSKRPTLGAIDKSTGWARSTLSSIALLCGHEAAARALSKAGCDSPDATLASEEISSRADSNKLSLLMSTFEDDLLREAIQDPHGDPKPAGLVGSSQEPADSPPKRRIIKA